jgi:hypothetical protein
MDMEALKKAEVHSNVRVLNYSMVNLRSESLPVFSSYGIVATDWEHLGRVVVRQ